ncbi:hypothetical protein BC831DRAFT_445394, partial [Entophlyctis helioformis]
MSSWAVHIGFAISPTAAMQPHVPLLLAVLSSARCVSAMDWVLSSVLSTCPGTSVPARVYDTANLILPATLPTEPPLCVAFPSTYRSMVYTDSSRSSAILTACPMADCRTNCSSSETISRWSDLPTAPCGAVFAPISPSRVITIADIESAVSRSSAVAKLGQGPAASAYYLQLKYPLVANCSGDPISATVGYLFETCSRISTDRFAKTLISDTEPKLFTEACSDAQCIANCSVISSSFKPTSPRGSAPQCMMDPPFSRLTFDAKALTSASRYPAAPLGSHRRRRRPIRLRQARRCSSLHTLPSLLWSWLVLSSGARGDRTADETPSFSVTPMLDLAEMPLRIFSIAPIGNLDGYQQIDDGRNSSSVLLETDKACGIMGTTFQQRTLAETNPSAHGDQA